MAGDGGEGYNQIEDRHLFVFAYPSLPMLVLGDDTEEFFPENILHICVFPRLQQRPTSVERDAGRGVSGGRGEEFQNVLTGSTCFFFRPTAVVCHDGEDVGGRDGEKGMEGFADVL